MLMPILAKWRVSGCHVTRCFANFRERLSRSRSNFEPANLPPAEFARQFAPRLQFILDQLNVHHQIEDFHYFPIFRAADARLAIGFDVLEGDHHHIHGDMARTAVDPPTPFYRRWGAIRTPCDAVAMAMPMQARRC